MLIVFGGGGFVGGVGGVIFGWGMCVVLVGSGIGIEFKLDTRFSVDFSFSDAIFVVF